MEKKQLSRFQKNMNDFTFYLLMMLEKCNYENLKFYDKNYPFFNNFDLLYKVDNELFDIIEDDPDLFINQKLPSGENVRDYIDKKIKEVKEKQIPQKTKDKLLNDYLQKKFLEFSNDYPMSSIDIYRVIFKTFSIVSFILFILFVPIFSLMNIYGKIFTPILLLISIFFLIQWKSYKKTLNFKNPEKLTFKHLFSISYCNDKINNAKNVLEQVLFENNPFERLEENILYRQIIKASPKMKIVFKVMIENSYWHYDGRNIIQTEKCTRQIIGKLAADSDLGINAYSDWKKPCQKLMLLPTPLYKYNKSKDDVTWEEIKNLIENELKK